VLAARPAGGACQFLQGTRCGVHDGRPFPCREFPISVHLGERPQASLVLTCPGIPLDLLGRDRSAARLGPPQGLETELLAARTRLSHTPRRELDDISRRRRRVTRILDRAGRWLPEEAVRAELRARVPFPDRESFPVVDPPAAEDGLEFLPIYFDGRAGPVGIGAGLGGWELLELRPEGGVAAHLGVVPPAETLPLLDEEARTLLRGYLRYHLERDAFLAAVALDMTEGSEGDLFDWAEAELRSLGATVLSRAALRAKAGRDVQGPLNRRDVADGIRATDQETLDRPTWGARL
jgi:hypothetical protein